MLSFKNYLLEAKTDYKKVEKAQFKKLKDEIDRAKEGRGYINLRIPGYHGVEGRPEFTKISGIENLPDKFKADFKLISPDGDDHHIFIGHKGPRHQQFGGVKDIEDAPFQEKILDKLDWQTQDVPSHIAVPSEYNHILKKVIWGKNQGNESYGPHNIQASYIGTLTIAPHSNAANEPVHVLSVDGDALHNPQHGGKIPSNIVLYKRRRTGGLRDTIIHFRELQQVPGTSKAIK